MALPVTTKSLLKTSPDAAMLFAPFRCTHPRHCWKWHHEAESLM